MRTYVSPRALDGEAALEETRRFLAVGPRVSGTPGAATAAAYLEQRLRVSGIESFTDTFTEQTPVGPVTFRNVVGIVPGSEEHTIILASHYDTKHGIDPAFVGANDSGSSTGLLLALAPLLDAAAPLPATVLLAFLDGEECRVAYGPNDGLHGSRHMAATLVRNQRNRRVRAVIVLDMIGDRDLRVTLPRNADAALLQAVFDAAREEGVRDRFVLMRGALVDDHAPFLKRRMPAVNLIDFEYGSRPGANDYWHTPQDTLDKLSAGSLQTVGRVTLRLVNRLLSDVAAAAP